MRCWQNCCRAQARLNKAVQVLTRPAPLRGVEVLLHSSLSLDGAIHPLTSSSSCSPSSTSQPVASVAATACACEQPQSASMPPTFEGGSLHKWPLMGIRTAPDDSLTTQRQEGRAGKRAGRPPPDPTTTLHPHPPRSSCMHAARFKSCTTLAPPADQTPLVGAPAAPRPHAGSAWASGSSATAAAGEPCDGCGCSGGPLAKLGQADLAGGPACRGSVA